MVYSFDTNTHMNSKTPLVTIGLPVYNGIPYVQKAIESALAQTYTNIELIISDNPSTDATQQVCEEYAKKDSRVRYIRHNPNIGACPNYTYALHAAHGEYFMWVSYDDYLDPTYIEKCMARITKDPHAAMVMADYVHVNEKGERVLKMDTKGFVVTEKGLYERLKQFTLMPWGLGKAMTIHGLWRRSAIANDVYSDLPDGDINFSFRGLAHGTFLFVNEILFFKGTLPGAESKEHDPLTISRIIAAIYYRLALIRTQFWNTGFIFKQKQLSLTQKLKLCWWNAVVVFRFLTHRNY